MPKDDQPRSLLLKEEITEPDKVLLIARLERRQPPAVGIFDEPTRCYRVNEQWVSHIAGAVSLLTEVQAWVGAVDERHSAIQSILQFLQGTVCDVIDCNDTEDCLETSDAIAGIGIGLYANLRNQTQDYLDTLDTAYDGTPQSIDADIPLTAPNLDPDHDTALCYALEFAVANYAATKRAEISLVNNLGDVWQAVLSGLRGVFPNIPNNLMYLLGDELYGCVPSFGDAIVALESDGAKNSLACCLYDELRGAPVDETAYNAALATCAMSLTALAGDLACLMSNDNGVDHALVFFVQYGQALKRIAVGETLACNCNPNWCYAYDFEFTTYNWTLIQFAAWPYEEGDIGIGGTTSEPVEISLPISGGYVTDVDYRVFGVGVGGLNVEIYADDVLLYSRNVNDGLHTAAINQNVTTLRWYAVRTFGWGISEFLIHGVNPDPILLGDACV